ncbi:MAG: ABC transporter ATP-binding protein [Bdellovibrionota bacterium]
MKKFSVFSRLWPYMLPYFWPIFFSAMLSIPAAAINFSPALIIQYLNDQVLVKKDPHALHMLALGIPLAFLVNFVVRFFNNYLIRSAANRMTQQLRNDLYQHLLRLSMGYFNSAQSGVLLSRVTNDVQVISRCVSGIIDVVKEPLTLVALIGYAFYLNWKLTLITMVMVPACALLIGNASKHSKRYTTRILNSLGDMSALLSESVGGIRVVQAFRLENYLRGQFMKINRDFTRTSLKAIRMEELSRPAVEFVFGLAMTFLVYYAGHEAIRGRMTPGEVMAFFVCWGAMLNPLKRISELNISLSQSAAAVDSVLAIMDLRPEVENHPNAKRAPSFSREIEFRDVSFTYEGTERAVLKKFTLKIKKGELVALVGPSGAGKSTVLSLIPRFFDPTSGGVLLDGMDMRDATLESLREQVALVTQDVFLFHDTVRANIKAGQHQMSDAQIRAAAEAAQAWNYIERLPQGLDTVIGDRGQKLSGGERQRLSIARAILKDAPILLLDEATSALDSENERLVQAALDQLLVGRTAIVVAHRLSTIRKADRILVMEKGEIIEEGAHDALLARGGAYAKAISLQGGFSP